MEFMKKFFSAINMYSNSMCFIKQIIEFSDSILKYVKNKEFAGLIQNEKGMQLDINKKKKELYWNNYNMKPFKFYNSMSTLKTYKEKML